MSDANVCSDRSGFLFSHECTNPAVNECSRCHSWICSDHSRSDDYGQTLCVSCLKGRRRRGRDTPSHSRQSDRDPWHDDPYFYGPYYYSDWDTDPTSRTDSTHHDPADFTEADGESLASESGTEFESDMSES